MEPERKTLLLVEDEAIIALAEKASLAREGYSVIHSLSGEDAIAAVESEHGSSIDLVLMDIDLGGGIDGTRAAQEILKRRDIPVVFLSSHTERELVERTESITNYGYIVKNVGNTVLFASIKMAFRLHEAHRRLEESEERFRNLIESIQEGMCIMDEEDRFVFANPAAHAILGVEMGRLAGERLDRFLDSRAAAYIAAQNEERKQGGKGEYEQELLRPNGERRILQVRASPRFGTRGRFEGSFVIFEDITEERRAAQRIRESEADYRSLFEDSANAIVEEDFSGVRAFLDKLRSEGAVDLRSRFASHPEDILRCVGLIRIVRANKEWLTIIGLERMEDMEPSLMPYVNRNSDSLAGIRDEIVALAEGQAPFEREFPNNRLSSKVEWVKLRMSVVPGHEEDWSKVFVSFMDITEQKKAQCR
ncbi:MAG TPA: PAS domain S-box protein [Rectinemataceae bacterium]|nr:PAS domain S-box protein [Rectinemataceae bacterium]